MRLISPKSKLCLSKILRSIETAFISLDDDPFFIYEYLFSTIACKIQQKIKFLPTSFPPQVAFLEKIPFLVHFCTWIHQV